MKAFFSGLRALQDKLRDKIAFVQIDSMTVVSFLTKKVASRLRLTRDVLLWCREQDVAPRAAYVVGMASNITDSLSRSKETEWFLSPEIVGLVLRRSICLPLTEPTSCPGACLWTSQTQARMQWTLSANNGPCHSCTCLSPRHWFPLC